MRLTYLRRAAPKLRTFSKYNSNLAQSQTSRLDFDFEKSSEDAGVTVFQGKPSLFPVVLHLARRQGLPASLGSLQGTIRSATSLHLAFFRGVIWDFEN